ncbi:hypothetical protein COU18_03445 [Candidatus Kaiserbacteria bacterium CG10_big_fil_rev_8_21_14_0_10_51_14]|uniref:Uncharacterized protein n=1 Tax=Candidatus Kaiserbacteria bacterium CG10_big_fil_rev_8_21_14_0_10_51_14 TaxID=1974610 RepID=A0A2H0UBC5_9BACT|nr:MAG: hypothetical protein COU18_03445 [Candidatus Kaiserbacteria bacterium CG10_big_fil_rev_8_21_14_0_10_51_14]
MRYVIRYIQGVAVLVGVVPISASAFTIPQVIGLFNVFVGLMLTVAILLFCAGFITWIARLGTWPSYRTEAIKIMEWSVVVLFVLVVLLAIVQFFQNHPRAAGYVVSTIVLLVVLGAIFVVLFRSGEKEEKH